MINEPFEPVSEPRACGWPYHGWFIRKHVGGVIEQKIVRADGVEYDLPSGVYSTLPQNTNLAFRIRHPDAPELDLTVEEKESELAEGRTWLNYALISGQLGAFYGVNLGISQWIAVLEDGHAWKVWLWPNYSEGRYFWVLEFSRYSIGPIVPAGAPDRGFRHFSVEAVFNYVNGDNYYSQVTAQSAYLGGQSWFGWGVADMTDDGTKAILFTVSSGTSATAILTMPTAADMAALGTSFETASGFIPGTYKMIKDYPAGYDPAIGTVSQSGPVSSAASAWTGWRQYADPYATSQTAFTETSKNLLTTVEYSYDYEDVTVNGTGGAYRIYRCFTIPDRTYTITHSAEFITSLGPDGEPLRFKRKLKMDMRVYWTGKQCIDYYTYIPGGGAGPFPAPYTLQGFTEIKVDDEVRYGQERWVASNTNTVTKSYKWYGGNPSVNSTRVAIPKENPSIDTYSFYTSIPFFAAPFTKQVGDSGDWNQGNFDFSVAPPATNSYPQPSIVFRPEIPSSQLTYAPAIAAIPKGAYYRGMMVGSFLPKYNKVWAFDPTSHEIFVRDRAATDSADGYLYASYI